MPTTWTNVLTSTSPILAFDVQEVRNAISTYVSGYPWTHPTTTANSPIYAVDFVEMADAIQQLWTDLVPGWGLPQWSAYGENGAGPATGRAMFAQDLLDLRNWLNLYEINYESGNPQDTTSGLYGVYSLSYNPNPTAVIIDNTTWAQDVMSLGATVVRVVLYADPLTHTVDTSTYRRVLAYYSGLGIRVFGVITTDTLPPASSDPSDQPDAALIEYPTGSGLYSNNYIRALYPVVVNIATSLAGVCNTFEIWNEPNVPAVDNGDPIHSDRMGALMYYLASNVPSGTTLIVGGLFFNDDAPYDNSYLTGSAPDGEVGLYGPGNTMVQLWYQAQPADAPRPYPWDYLAIHPYFALQWGDAAHKNPPAWGNGVYALATMLQTMEDNGDRPGGDDPLIWVTEFGVERHCDSGSNADCAKPDNDAFLQAEALFWLFNFIFGAEQIAAAVWQTHESYHEGTHPSDEHYGLTNYSQGIGTPPQVLSIASSQRWPSWARMKTLTSAA